jgi:3-oxoacyl-[acyl-carrier protein] reductase
MSKLTGKVAVVTGASKGIGAGIAKALAAEGAAVVVNYASSSEGADRVVASIAETGGKAIAVQGDVAKSLDVRRLFAEAKKAFGRVDVLVNNAGVYEFAALGDITEEQFHRQFNTNVLGLILTTQEAARQFGDDGGNIINIGSTVSQLTPPTSAVYTATKGAVDAVTHVLAKELGPKKIRVNSINPRRDGGVPHGGLHWKRFPETVRSANPTRPNRTAGGHCSDRRVSSVVRFRMADGRNATRVGWTAVSMRGRRRWGGAPRTTAPAAPWPDRCVTRAAPDPRPTALR